ncbi:MAG: outer membrane protein assembly factor [Candidatus Hydrogenedentota bacterium]|nr:MAG: outer membrane protein assembly factor [Candidatus Hydrogenedentota bacterium]GIX45111.1 MAG: outer membrane protein assembly factor BamA [Candidatus Sumerlaea sp.]
MGIRPFRRAVVLCIAVFGMLPIALPAQPSVFPSAPAPTLSTPDMTSEPSDDAPEDLSIPGKPEVREKSFLEKDQEARGGGAARMQPPAPKPKIFDAPIVREVVVSGANPEDTKKALRVIQTRVGEPLDPDKQREDIRRLYELGLFSPNILLQADRTADGGVKLTYLVQPNPKVNDITVQGNVKIPTDKILSQLPVKKGQVYTVQAQNKIRESVQRYYEEKGYTDANVRVEERPAAGNMVNLVITVDEGTKTKIKDLIIRGNDHIRDLTIKLRTTNKGSWGPFTHYYNESRFQEDLETIKALYISRGFLDVDVQRGDFVYGPDQSWVSPVIEVREGPRYRVGRIDARGYTLFTREEVLQPFLGLQGAYYSAAKFNAAAEKVKNMYGDEGFLAAKVEPDFHKDSERGVVDVDVVITEGPRIYVGDVKIVAQNYPDDEEMGWLRKLYSRYTPPVKTEVIEREVRLRPGQVYRRFDEVRTRDRLRSLNVFEDVKVHSQLTDDPSVRDCVVEVTQGNTGSLIFGLGFGDVEGGFIYANYIERNLAGMARDLRVSGAIGSKITSFEVSYLDRYFRGTDTAAQFSVFHHRYLRTGGFHQTNTGATAEFTKPLTDTLKEAWRVRLESVSFSYDKGDEPKEKLNDYVAATIRYRVIRDTRDDSFFPTTGRYWYAGVETGAADGFLLKAEGQYATYRPVFNNWVWAMRTQAGLMPYDATNIGYADRFFLGGSQDMRGFKLWGAGPHDSGNEDIPLGGSTKLLVQNELRYPFTDNLAGVLFADFGVLGRKPFELTKPKASVGTGMRLRLPIAQVALDLAVPVLRDSKDQTQFFHFTFTSAF